MISELPVIDLELGAKLLDSDQQIAVKMIKELANSLQGNLQDLEIAYAAENISKIGNLAHYIHGGACYCGTPRLKAAAIALEKVAKAAHSLQDIEAEYRNLCLNIKWVIDADLA